MIDNQDQSSGVYIDAHEPNTQNPLPRRGLPGKKILLIVGVLVSLICFCCVVVIGAAVFQIINTNQERVKIEVLLDEYLTYMEAREVANAYALFSPRAQRFLPMEALLETVYGNNYELYDDYSSVSIPTIQLGGAISTNPEDPQGSIATVTGEVYYTDGFRGVLNAIFEEVDGVWRIHNITIQVPPNKIQ